MMVSHTAATAAAVAGFQARYEALLPGVQAVVAVLGPLLVRLHQIDAEMNATMDGDDVRTACGADPVWELLEAAGITCLCGALGVFVDDI